MQFLADNWFYFFGPFIIFLILLVLNFIKAGRDAMKFNTEGFQRGLFRHAALGLLCFITAIPAVIGVILAIIKFAQAN